MYRALCFFYSAIGGAVYVPHGNKARAIVIEVTKQQGRPDVYPSDQSMG